MKINLFTKCTTIGLALTGGVTNSVSFAQKVDQLPNILWIVSEDNSAYFTGCYDNPFATTPNIDKLASEGFLYTHAYATNAVCAPSRNTILTGVYSASNGNEHMRSTYPTSEVVRGYVEYLKSANYYCTNNSKTDYNTSDERFEKAWDENSNRAHYKNRPQGKPFFAVFNINTSHESSIQTQEPLNKLRHDPDKVPLPPYHPDTPEMRHDWAQYYDKIENMDSEVGAFLKELDSLGLSENTIVFYYGDNGGVLARSKRFVYETGTRVPLVIRIPQKFKSMYPASAPGQKVDRLINFVDMVPTLLSIANVPIPEYLQGDAFLGKQKAKDPEYTVMTRQRMDERYDNVRAVRDKKYRYIRNYMPYRVTMQHVQYLFGAASAQSWENMFKAGKTDEIQSRFFREKPVEELYDTENDPWEINNLVEDPAYTDVLARMRNALDSWRIEVRDAGVIPETEYRVLAGDKSLYDYVRSSSCPFEELIKASDLAVLGSPLDLSTYVEYLRSDNSALRYWGATGLLMLHKSAIPAIADLKKATDDNSAAVATLAAEALYYLGEKETAIHTYKRLLNTKEYDLTSRNFALNSIDAINDNSIELIIAVKEFVDDWKAANTQNSLGGGLGMAPFDIRVAQYQLSEWGVK